MSAIRIHPLNLGTITRPKVLFYYDFKELFHLIEVPIIAWYIENAEKRILVDTGGVDPEQGPEFAPYSRTEDQTIDRALERIGVGCAEIDVVINTHLHWDHCGANGLFPKAEFIVQKAELESALNPPRVYSGTYLRGVIEATRFTQVEGEVEITPGVSVVPLPGHTEGLQGILVDSGGKRHFICGDAVGLYQNLEANPPVPSGVYVNLRDSYTSLEKIKGSNAIALPGHEVGVFDRSYYG